MFSDASCSCVPGAGDGETGGRRVVRRRMARQGRVLGSFHTHGTAEPSPWDELSLSSALSWWVPSADISRHLGIQVSRDNQVQNLSRGTAGGDVAQVRWKMASAFGSQWPIQGELGTHLGGAGGGGHRGDRQDSVLRAQRAGPAARDVRCGLAGFDRRRLGIGGSMGRQDPSPAVLYRGSIWSRDRRVPRMAVCGRRRGDLSGALRAARHPRDALRAALSGGVRLVPGGNRIDRGSSRAEDAFLRAGCAGDGKAGCIDPVACRRRHLSCP